MSAKAGYTCKYCQKAKLDTLKGLHLHIKQSKACNAKLEQEVAATLDVDDVSEACDDSALQPDGLGDSDMDIDEFEIEEIHTAHSPPPEVEIPPSPRHQVTIEEVEDEDAHPRERQERAEESTDEFWIEDYPHAAGSILGDAIGSFEEYRRQREENGQSPWYPFESKDDWELARWLTLSGVSQKKMNSFLSLNSIRQGVDPAFHNARSLMQRIDALPQGPEWIYTPVTITGDLVDKDGNFLTEEVEIWHRNPVHCVEELVDNPTFEGHQFYEPQRVYKNNDGSRTNRVFSDMRTANWWWNTQERLPKGATVCPLILSSDKTNLTRFSGDKQAWPLYISVALNDKELRRKPSAFATILVGYIPVCKLDCFSEKMRSVEGYRLFHDFLRIMLAPLVKAGSEGVKMACADGHIRLMYLILAAYIADYPEQCLVTCCKENSCPKCTVDPKRRGDCVYSVLRDPGKTLELIQDELEGNSPGEFKAQNLRPVRPFWENLPHCNIFECITPDILHQLHKGLFNDHLVKWSAQAMDGKTKEMDRRFQMMTPHQSLRHFKNGISLTTQWTGKEFKNMEKVLLGVLAEITDPRVIRAARGLLDFIYYAHFETHTEESLAQLDAAWTMFHDNKKIFEELKIRQHFNISKLHNIKHYTESIQSLGTADGYNTENTERLHIDFAKEGYNASNKKNYISQMTTWLTRQEAIHRFTRYLQWAIPGYEVVEPLDDEDEEADEDEVEKSQEESDKVYKGVQDRQATTSFAVAKKPAVVGADAQSITDDYGTVNFLYYVDEFRKKTLPLTEPISESATFSLYKRVVLQLPPIPEVSSQPTFDVIQAVKGVPQRETATGVKKETPPKFSAVLVRVKSSGGSEEADSPISPLDGLRAAHVRLLFKLPEEFGFDEPLAYVDWFTAFNNSPQASTGMFTVSHSSNAHQRRASVIRISDIARSCHLIPAFGKSKTNNLGWTAERALDQCKSFYFNPYLRHHDFYHFRHLFNLYLEKRSTFEQEQASARRNARKRKRK